MGNRKVDEVLANTRDLIEEQLIQEAYELEKEAKGIKLSAIIEENKKRLEKCEEKFQSQGEGYKSKRFPLFTDKLEGLESNGTYIFAGESNSGKTALMTAVFVDLVENEENHLYGIYYSLDDSESSICARVASMKMTGTKEDTGETDEEGNTIYRRKEIPISVFTKPKRYQKLIDSDERPELTSLYMRYMQIREEGLDYLKKLVERITFIDINSEYATNQTAMYNFIKKMKREIVKKDPQANILVAIDAFDDIYLDYSTDQETAEKARALKKWCNELDIPIFCSKHLKKLGSNRRPVLDDLKDSNRLLYDASVVFLIHNDVSKNKTAAKVFDSTDDPTEKLPVIEIDWAKNKKSSYKGYTFAHFRPNNSYTEEVLENQMSYYIRQLNG